MKKRHVIKNSNQLGIDEMHYHGNPNSTVIKTRLYWYVYDKQEEKIVEGAKFQERQFAKTHADKLNS